jgi:hypothetical protein
MSLVNNEREQLMHGEHSVSKSNEHLVNGEHEQLMDGKCTNDYCMNQDTYSVFLFTFLCPTQENFTYMEILQLPVKGCKI